jgi:hypothetical protein
MQGEALTSALVAFRAAPTPSDLIDIKAMDQAVSARPRGRSTTPDAPPRGPAWTTAVDFGAPFNYPPPLDFRPGAQL